MLCAVHILFQYLSKVDIIVLILEMKKLFSEMKLFAEGHTLSNKAGIQNQICLTLKSDLFPLY